MIGKYQITIGWEDFVKGMTTSVETGDGGFSPESDSINPIKTPGVIYPAAAETDVSVSSSGKFIASCEDPSSNNYNRVFVTTNAKFFSYSSGTLTLRQTDVTNTYVDGTTDMVPFNGAVYATSQGDIAKWTVNSAFDATWWTGTKSRSPLSSSYRHPLLVFNKNMYVANGNILYKIDSSENITTILTIDSSESIVALGIDPGSGRMLVSVTSNLNVSGTRFGAAFIGLYDGINPTQFIRKIPVNEQVNSFYNLRGTVYVFYGKSFGYFTGSGVEFIRDLGLSLAQNDLAYKHHVTNIGSTLYFIQGQKIIAYGSIIQGQSPVFYSVLKNPTSTDTNYSLVTHIGSGVLAYGCNDTNSAGKVRTLDTTSSASVLSGSPIFYSKKYTFPRKIYVRGIQFNTTTVPGSGTIQANLIHHTGNSTTLGSMTSAFTEPFAEFIGFDVITNQFQVLIQFLATNIGLRSVSVFYDVAE